MNGRRPGRASASAPPPPSALHPQRLRPSSTWRAVRVACLAPASMVTMVAPLYLPSISGARSTSSYKYKSATPTPRRRRGAAPWRYSSSSPTRPICTWTETWRTLSSDAARVMPTCGNLDRVPRTLGSVHRAWRALPRPFPGTRVRIEFTARTENAFSCGVGSLPPRAMWFIAEVRSHQDLPQQEDR